MTSFWKRAETMPPTLCRLLARHRWGRPLTDIEICNAPGLIRNGVPILKLTPREVFCLGESVTWRGVDIPTAHAFLIGCGIDFCNAKQMKRIDSYLRSKPNFKYLRTDKEWQSKWEPMIKRWMENCACQI